MAFAVGDQECLIPRLAVRSQLLPELLPPPFRDTYISINQSRRVQRGGTLSGKRIGSGKPCHRTNTMRYLCAAYADLDFYNIGIGDQDVISRLDLLQSEGIVPPVSLLVHSGRGIWALWLLRHASAENEAVVVTQDGNELEVHSRVQQALYNRLAHLGADSNAVSPVRYLRRPGSFNSKSETFVRWEFQFDEYGRVKRYRLAELHRALEASGVLASTRPESLQRFEYKYRSRGSSQPADSRRGRAGWEALRARRLADFQTLRRLRGTFRKGLRNNAVFYYSRLLASTGKPIESATLDVFELNATFRPPLRRAEVEAAVKSAYTRRYRKLYDQTIADLLDIRPDEAIHLKCKTFARRFQRAEDVPPPKRRRAETDGARITRRRAAIGQVIAELHGYVPSTREMAGALRSRGIAVGHVTLAKDYAQMDLRTSRKKSCQNVEQTISLAADLDADD